MSNEARPRSFAISIASMLALLVAACGDDGNNPDGAGNSNNGGAGAGEQGGTANPGGAGGIDATGGAGGTDATGGAGGTPIVETPRRKIIAGDVTWSVTFDDTAKAAGATDCTYTRHYDAVEDESAKWFCASCEVIFRSTVEMTDGFDDCFSQISPGATPATEEWIGYGNGVYYRGLGATMSEQGTAASDGDAVTTANMIADQAAPVGGLFGFTIAGNFLQGEADGDPMNGFIPPATYACGWEKAVDVPAYTGDYTIVEGQTVPDGLFKDACDETVRLHDLKGSYLLIEMSARDCPPCQALADNEEAFISDLAAKGIKVEVVTLLAPSLSNTLGNTTVTMLNSWKNKYALTSPVLADRGWGLSMFIPVFGDQVGYPSIVLVDPELNVMTTQAGFGDFSEISALIEADAGM